jgi:hypothetical protein
MPHQFEVGQLVRLSPAAIPHGAPQIYEVVRLIPFQGGQPLYRLAKGRPIREGGPGK